MRTKLLLPALPLIFLAACAEPARDTAAADRKPAVPVMTVPAGAEDWPAIYEATGTVRAQTSAVIAAKVMGYVRTVNVQAGDRVREGQPLLRLEARDLDSGLDRANAARETVRQSIPAADAGVEAAKASLDLEQATFRRMQELYDKKSISDHEFDEASAQLKSAQAAYDMARAKRAQIDAELAQAGEDVRAAEIARGYAAIAAPFAGIVTAKSVDPGTLATPGAPLLTIEREGAYRLEAAVEESRMGAVRAGQPVSVTLDGIDGAIAARVSEIVPAVDAASRSYIVKIDLPSRPGLRSGLFGRAAFDCGTRRVTAIPAGAVTERGELQSVMVDDDGIARTRLITAGQRDKDRLEVLSGLNPGDKIIFPVPNGLADGERLETTR